MVPLHKSLVKMGWPQPKSPIQTNNITALGISNKTITTKKMKSMDMCLCDYAAVNPKADSTTTGALAPPTMQITQPKLTPTSTMNL